MKFIYSGEDIINTENADAILKAAVMLQIKCLQQRCEEFMTENVDAENCLAVWKLASAHGCVYLAQKAWMCVLHCFEFVCESEDFLRLDCDDVLSIIKDNDLNTPNEKTFGLILPMSLSTLEINFIYTCMLLQQYSSACWHEE